MAYASDALEEAMADRGHVKHAQFKRAHDEREDFLTQGGDCGAIGALNGWTSALTSTVKASGVIWVEVRY